MSELSNYMNEIHELNKQYAKLRARASRYSDSIHNRIVALAPQAGLTTGDCLWIHMHNAWVGRKTNPWKSVNYTVLNKMLDLQKRQFIPYHLLDSWYMRKVKAIQAKYWQN